MHYYQFNIGDYMRDTAHLDEMEDLAYRRMLDLYYLKESPLPKDVKEIAKLIRMRTHTDCIASVLQEFFALSESGYINEKADEVLAAIYDKSDKARLAAEKRWNKQKVKNADAMQTHSEGNADGMLPNTQYPIPNNPDTQLKDSGESEKRKRFTPPNVEQVDLYMRKLQKGSKLEAQKFVDFYESKGWMVGKNKMKSWEASVRTWLSKTPQQPARRSGFDLAGLNYESGDL